MLGDPQAVVLAHGRAACRAWPACEALIQRIALLQSQNSSVRWKRTLRSMPPSSKCWRDPESAQQGEVELSDGESTRTCSRQEALSRALLELYFRRDWLTWLTARYELQVSEGIPTLAAYSYTVASQPGQCVSRSVRIVRGHGRHWLTVKKLTRTALKCHQPNVRSSALPPWQLPELPQSITFWTDR